MWIKDPSKEAACIQEMERLVSQYNNLTLAAQRCRRENAGKGTPKEAEYYHQAAEICKQLIRLNLSERVICAKWNDRKQACEHMIEEIAHIPASKPAASAAPDYTVAPSGFVSKNACEDIPAQVIEQWHKPKPRIGFDDIIGMEGLKERLLRENDWYAWPDLDAIFNINPTRGYIFYGLPGTGKTALVRAFAHEMIEQDENFRFIELNGGDIHASLIGVAEKTVAAAFREAMDNAPCLLFFDDIDSICCNRSNPNIQRHKSRLTVAFLAAYHDFLYSRKRVLFIGATNRPEMVDDFLLDHAALVKIPLPDEPTRGKYFAKAFERLVLDEGFSIDDMVDRTDNYSYRDMNRLSECVRLKVKLAVLDACQIFDRDGRLDMDATDRAAIAALKEGRIPLTRAMFEEALLETPVSDKTSFLSQLADFEKNIEY